MSDQSNPSSIWKTLKSFTAAKNNWDKSKFLPILHYKQIKTNGKICKYTMTLVCSASCCCGWAEVHCVKWAFIFKCNHLYSCCLPTGHVYQINIWWFACNHRDNRRSEYERLCVRLCRSLPRCSSTSSVIYRVRCVTYMVVSQWDLHGGEMEQQLMTLPLCLSISLWLTAVRKSMLEMKSFRSIIRRW